MNKTSTSVKILLGAMIGAAGLIAVSIFINAKNITGLGANINEIFKNGVAERPENLSGAENTTTCSDIDKDGLCDHEEPLYGTDVINPDTDGDGFLDGEEVAAGHDPTKPGPNDLLLTGNNLQSVNITDKVSALMAGAFYAGDLSASADPEIYTQALADISIEMLSDGAQVLNPNNISINKTILSSDSKEAQEDYLNRIGSIIQVDLWGELVNEPRLSATKFTNFYTENDRVIADSQKYFDSKADYYKQIINKVGSVPVPPSWLDVHKQIISNLQTLAVSHQALSQTAEDPLKGVLAMENLIPVYQNIQPILITITQKIKKNNLSPPNGQLWSLVNSLTDGF